MLIAYPDDAEIRSQSTSRLLHRARRQPKSVRVGLLGAGSFAVSTCCPRSSEFAGVEMIVVSAANGSHARHAAEKFGFRSCTTDEQEILNNPSVNTVVIATRHHLHAAQVIAALESGKHVFCEKPLCLNEAEFSEIVAAYVRAITVLPARPLLMVGFNRRFAPLALRMKSFLQEVQRAAGASLSRERRLPSCGSLAERSTAGRRPHSRRGLPLRGLPLLSDGLFAR